MLVLLMGKNYECAAEVVSGGMIYIQNFMKISTNVEGILKFILNNLKGCSGDITVRIYKVQSSNVITSHYVLST
jgi:hypothetical protein